MSVALAADRTIVSRLRIRRSSVDPTLARLRAATLLSSAALTPSGLSPAAILIVRQLKDPMPGKLGLRSAAIRLPYEWEEAVRSQMAALTQRALRPIRDAVSETAEAVLFADHGELLACLARDWLHGSVGRWWWQALFPDRALAAAVVRAWLERADCIPAAMAHLAASGDELAFVLRLEDEVRRTLLQSVLQVHGLRDLQSALGPVVRSDNHASDRTALFEAVPQHRTDLRRSQERAKAPWSAQSGSQPGLGVVVEAFVGVCLALSKAPQRVRSRDFADQARRWTEWQIGAERASRETVAAPTMAPAIPPELDRDALGPAELEAGDGQGRPAMPAKEKPDSRRPRSAEPQRMRQAVHLADHPADEASEPLELPAMESALQARPVRVADELDEQRIDTQFGGVFLLINLGLFLELYGDFANPGRPGIELSIWDFIALLAENLLGPELRDEPVWSLLARLAGRRDREAPGRGLPGRRRLKRRLPFLRSRLRRALGVATDVEVGSLLLRRAARVCVTPTRLDVSFSLAELPIEVRRSGLDRDPGWVPAAGRTIRFHFD